MDNPTHLVTCGFCGKAGGHHPGCFGDKSSAVRDANAKIKGVKFDDGKARHDLIPPELPEAVATVLAFGAAKYGERNWEKGMGWGRPFAALMRHMWAWWRGEINDPETGLSHLSHAACNIAFLLAFEARKAGVDDRRV